ncbi:MAG: cation transporter [Oligoflexus sp.]
MDDCCQNKSSDLQALARQHAIVLWIVLVINIIMFFVELTAGFISESTALLGDSLDMLGDSLAYGSSLFVLGSGLNSKAKSAYFKGILMLIIGCAILGRAIYHSIFPEIPSHEIMTGIGLLALIANLACLAILTKHRSDDINMKSVWICSRNDIIANVSVISAAGLVFLLGSPIPDLIVGFGLAFLFLRSAFAVIAEARSQIRSFSPSNS